MVYLLSLNMVLSLALVAACVWLYYDGRGRRMAAAAAKLENGVAWETDMLARVVDHDLRIGVLERRGEPPPVAPLPPPPVSFSPAPGGLPLKPVTLTRDAPVEAPPPASEVAPASTAPPPSTVPQRSRKVASLDQTLVSEGMVPPASASRTVVPDPVAARAAERLAELDDELGPEGKAAIRARIEAAEDERDRARARGEAPASLPTEGEPDEDEHRDTWEDATRMIDRAMLPPLAPLAGRPHAPPRRVASMLPPPLVPPTTARREALTPTDPTMPAIDARIERIWHRMIAAAQEAGRNARHCHGERCFHDTGSVSVCECACDGCELIGELLIAAKREATGRE